MQSLTDAGALASERDLRDAEIHFLDAQTFALETRYREIAQQMRAFLARALASERQKLSSDNRHNCATDNLRLRALSAAVRPAPGLILHMAFTDPKLSGWIPQASDSGQHPHMTRAFATAYEQAATQITGPVSCAALDRLGAVDRGTRILDIAAGSGAFSVPAAHRGAAVTAIDVAPGMIEVLKERLSPFPRARVFAMDGQQLDFDDASFDAAVSVFGISLFPDWRVAIGEQVRVLRPGGTAVLATWRRPPGGGPFLVMAEALRATFPHQSPPAPPTGFLGLAEPDAMREQLASAGLADVNVEEIEAVWEGPAGAAYLEELQAFHRFVGPYAFLDADDRALLDASILEIVNRMSENGRVILKITVTLGVGTRP